MGEINELNQSIMALTELWEACDDDDQKEEILRQRDDLRLKARELSKQVLNEGTPELVAATEVLARLTKKAKEETDRLNNTVKKVNEFSDFIDEVADAAAKVAVLIA